MNLQEAIGRTRAGGSRTRSATIGRGLMVYNPATKRYVNLSGTGTRVVSIDASKSTLMAYNATRQDEVWWRAGGGVPAEDLSVRNAMKYFEVMTLQNLLVEYQVTLRIQRDLFVATLTKLEQQAELDGNLLRQMRIEHAIENALMDEISRKKGQYRPGKPARGPDQPNVLRPLRTHEPDWSPWVQKSKAAVTLGPIMSKQAEEEIKRVIYDIEHGTDDSIYVYLWSRLDDELQQYYGSSPELRDTAYDMLNHLFKIAMLGMQDSRPLWNMFIPQSRRITRQDLAMATLMYDTKDRQRHIQVRSVKDGPKHADGHAVSRIQTSFTRGVMKGSVSYAQGPTYATGIKPLHPITAFVGGDPLALMAEGGGGRTFVGMNDPAHWVLTTDRRSAIAAARKLALESQTRNADLFRRLDTARTTPITDTDVAYFLDQYNRLSKVIMPPAEVLAIIDEARTARSLDRKKTILRRLALVMGVDGATLIRALTTNSVAEINYDALYRAPLAENRSILEQSGRPATSIENVPEGYDAASIQEIENSINELGTNIAAAHQAVTGAEAQLRQLQDPQIPDDQKPSTADIETATKQVAEHRKALNALQAQLTALEALRDRKLEQEALERRRIAWQEALVGTRAPVTDPDVVTDVRAYWQKIRDRVKTRSLTHPLSLTQENLRALERLDIEKARLYHLVSERPQAETAWKSALAKFRGLRDTVQAGLSKRLGSKMNSFEDAYNVLNNAPNDDASRVAAARNLYNTAVYTFTPQDMQDGLEPPTRPTIEEPRP